MLTIARAMLLDSKMLILDEATSNVDTQTEEKIQLAMRELMKGKTCFVIAHRLSTIQNADHILVVQNGDIVEQGTHDTLLGQGGLYAKLIIHSFNNVSADESRRGMWHASGGSLELRGGRMDGAVML